MIFIAVTVSLVSFLLGSFPTAYLMVRKNSGKDLRQEGTGNIGAMNAYEVKVSLTQFLSRALDEAGAYEVQHPDETHRSPQVP